jgi:glyoxylase-like metal-dependent hydrolase (beta-lactamase superfamily II)
MREGNVFCGYLIFHADIGTARSDFPGGSVKNLYASAQRLLKVPDNFKIWTWHDYPACLQRCEAVPWMTVRDHKERNRHLANYANEDHFLMLRETRDAGLAAPKLLHPSLQMNIRPGKLPLRTPGGERFMHFPIEMSEGMW